MKRIARFFLPSAFLLALAAPAAAQNQNRFEFFAGPTLPLDRDFQISSPQSTAPLDGTHEFSPGARVGLRLGWDGRGHWGQDLIYSYGANSSRIVNRTNGGQFGFTMRSHQISYNALFYPAGLDGSKSVFPYITIGVGGTINTLSQKIVNEALDPNRAGLGKLHTDSTFTANAGAGVRVRVNSLYGFRIDVRDYMSRAVRFGLPKESTDPNASVFPVGGIHHRLDFTVTFVYHF